MLFTIAMNKPIRKYLIIFLQSKIIGSSFKVFQPFSKTHVVLVHIHRLHTQCEANIYQN